MEGIHQMSKVELLAQLSRAVSGWPGLAPIQERWAGHIRVLDAALGACFLSIMEQQWQSLCACWAARAAHGQPDVWLKNHWMLTLWTWEDFVQQSGIGADSHPDPRAFPPPGQPRPAAWSNPRAMDVLRPPKPEPGHLPFGFVKPWL